MSVTHATAENTFKHVIFILGLDLVKKNCRQFRCSTINIYSSRITEFYTFMGFFSQHTNIEYKKKKWTRKQKSEDYRENKWLEVQARTVPSDS